MTTNEIVGRLKAGGLDASSTNRSAAVYVTEARSGRAEPGWFGFRIVCDSESTERRVRAILSRWYDIDASGNVWRLRAKNRVPLMAIKRGGVPPTPPTPTGDYMYFEAAQANSTVSMMSMLQTAPDLEYSTDGETWQEWQHTTETEEGMSMHTFDLITLESIGDKVYLRGNNEYLGDSTPIGVSFFVLFGSLNSGGNLTTLLESEGVVSELPDYAFRGLLSNLMEDEQHALLSLPNLNGIVKIGNSSLYGLCSGCENITEPIDLKDVQVIGHSGCFEMYSDCTSLSIPSDLPALTQLGIGGCENMYRNSGVTRAAIVPLLTSIPESGFSYTYDGCISLASDCDLSNVTTIGDYGCMGMYYNCELIESATDLENLASIGERACCYMYRSCSGLESPADMPLLTTVGESGLQSMYAGCTALEIAANMPMLTSIGKDGFANTYSSCTFNMSDDGATLNFDFPTPPITTTGDDPQTFATAYDVAGWMGNTNGFTTP